MPRPRYRPGRVALLLPLILTLTLTLAPISPFTAAPAAALGIGQGDQVAYVDSDGNVWVSHDDGSAPRQVTPGGFGDVAWSADSSRLLVEGPFAGGQGVYLASPDGSVALTPLHAGDRATWSPDSSRLALIDNGTIQLYSRDGGGLRSAAVGADALLWSPDARKLGYTRITDAPYGTDCPTRALGWVNSDTGESKEIARTIGKFAWAYDGNRLLYVSADDGAIHSYDTATGAGKVLSNRTANPCGGPFFTTLNGDRLLFLDYGAGGKTLVVLNVDNGQEQTFADLQVGYPADTLPAPFVSVDPSGRYVDLVQAYPTTITRLDLQTGARTTLLANDYRQVVGFSADHQRVALLDNPYGKPTVIWLRDLASGNQVPFTNDGALVFEPDAATPSSVLAWNRTWAREDQPVATGVQRSWTWGPAPFATLDEQYVNAPGGERAVRYYDKSRMEINNPSGDQSTRWYVTNGLLAKELITGQMQVGDQAFVNRGPAQINVAGDPGDPNGPTYATLNGLLGAPPVAVGSEIKASLDRGGAVGSAGRGGVFATQLIGETNHTVANIFWDYLNSQGPIWDGGKQVNGQLFDPTFFATGFPITEAYWTRVQVGGVTKDVLLQCFERRCLTYTPDNPAGWQVEMGNVGRHYYQWRYGG